MHGRFKPLPLCLQTSCEPCTFFNLTLTCLINLNTNSNTLHYNKAAACVRKSAAVLSESWDVNAAYRFGSFMVMDVTLALLLLPLQLFHCLQNSLNSSWHRNIPLRLGSIFHWLHHIMVADRQLHVHAGNLTFSPCPKGAVMDLLSGEAIESVLIMVY